MYIVFFKDVPTLELKQTTNKQEFKSYSNKLGASLTFVRKVNGRYHRVVEIHRGTENKKNCLVLCHIRYND